MQSQQPEPNDSEYAKQRLQEDQAAVHRWLWEQQLKIVQPWHVVVALAIMVIIEHSISRPMPFPLFIVLTVVVWLTVRGLWLFRHLGPITVGLWELRQLRKQHTH